MFKNNFFVIRHGESENNILQIDSSKLENKNQFGLSKKGRQKIQIEARKFKDFDLIISSPFRRTKETAIIFAKTSKCEVIENELLREVDVGDFELCKYEESDAFYEEHGDESIPYPNGESLLDAKNRTTKFLELTDQRYNDKKILIVTHGWIVFFLLKITDKNFDSEEYLNNYDEDRYVIELKHS